jgi:hypothetical protein
VLLERASSQEGGAAVRCSRRERGGRAARGHRRRGRVGQPRAACGGSGRAAQGRGRAGRRGRVGRPHCSEGEGVLASAQRPDYARERVVRGRRRRGRVGRWRVGRGRGWRLREWRGRAEHRGRAGGGAAQRERVGWAARGRAGVEGWDGGRRYRVG